MNHTGKNARQQHAENIFPEQSSFGAPESVHEVLAEQGQGLDSETRGFMEPRFGHDFSRVRIHTDDRAARSAREVNALAYAVDNDVVFGAGQYAPRTGQGQWLLAHELTHVAQQPAAPAAGGELSIGEPTSSLEQAASATASEVTAGRTVSVSAAQTGQRTLRRYQAGEAGHGGIEQQALTSAGFTAQQARSVYFGNWLRDLSQIPPGAFQLVNILALGEFGREIKPEDLGTYVPSEHLDNPEGGKTFEDSKLTPAERMAAWNKLSPQQQKAYEDEVAHIGEIRSAEKHSGLPEYIEVGKFHAKEKLIEAITAGQTQEGMAAMGNGLHAVEDYFSHSNFVEVAIWNLYKAGAMTIAQYNGLVGTELGHDAAKLGGPDPLDPTQPGIITGTYAPGANSAVSGLELICTETENGELTTSFIKGFLLKTGMTEEEILKRLASGGWTLGKDSAAPAGGVVGGAIGGALGAVGGAEAGALSGAEAGWRTHSGWSALGHAVTGLFSGAAAGTVTGAEEGYKTGEGAGETVAGTLGGLAGGALGGAIGLGIDGLITVLIAQVGGNVLLRIFPEIVVGMAAAVGAARSGLLDYLARIETEKAARYASAKGLGPTHSEIAKDSPHHPLYPASTALARFVDEEIGIAMRAAWSAYASAGSPTPAPPSITDTVTDLVGKYVSHPSRDSWWHARLLGELKAEGKI
jgi:hypothetical protein